MFYHWDKDALQLMIWNKWVKWIINEQQKNHWQTLKEGMWLVTIVIIMRIYYLCIYLWKSYKQSLDFITYCLYVVVTKICVVGELVLFN